MKDSIEKDKPTESNPLTDQTQQQTKSEPKPELQTLREPVFIRRAPGMPFEEFKKVCIQRFREAGFIKHDPKTEKPPIMTRIGESSKTDDHDNPTPRVAEDELSDPEKAEKYHNSGDDKIAGGDYQEAFEDLCEAIRLDPQNGSHYSLRGVANYELGRYEEAIEDESKSIEMCPTPDTLYNRSEAYFKTGRDAEALDDLDHALKLAREMPAYDFIISEIEKLVSIIKDKSISGKDYYQAPMGFGHGSPSTEPHNELYDDVGPEVILFVYESMRIDDQWSTKASRGFVWWGHHLAQKVWADDCRRDEGVDVTLLHVETDFLRNVENNERTYEALNDLNAGASQFAFIYDPKERRIKLHSTVYTHRQSLDWSKRLFLRAVGLQVTSAHTMVEKFSRLFAESEPDTSPHPDSGFRPERDELVGLIVNYYIPMGEKEYPPETGTFQFTREHLPPHLLATSGDDWITVEFPFSGNEPGSVRLKQGKPGVVTSIFKVNATEGHPMLGRGLMMRMMIPVSYGRVKALQIAMTLNLAEAIDWAKCHLNGAWCVDEQSNLVFTSFFPMAGFKSWELVNLTLSCGMRSRWAGEVLAAGGTDHPSTMLH